MGGAFDEAEIVWRKKGQHISKMSADDIKSIINRKFSMLQEDLGNRHGRSGYSCTLYECWRANINYFHFLSDTELNKLKNWIFNFEGVILGDRFINKFSKRKKPYWLWLRKIQRMITGAMSPELLKTKLGLLEFYLW